MDRSGWGGNKIALRPQLYSNGSTAISKISKSRDYTTKLGDLDGQKYDESGGIFCFGGYAENFRANQPQSRPKSEIFQKIFEIKYETDLKRCALKRAFE